MAYRLVESTLIYRSFGQVLQTLCPEKKSLAEMQEKFHKKLNCSALSVIFNVTYIKEIDAETRVHAHLYMYVNMCISIYIYSCICT